MVLSLNPTAQGPVRLIAAVFVEGMPQPKGLVIDAQVEGLQLQWQVLPWDPAKPLPQPKAAGDPQPPLLLQPLVSSAGGGGGSAGEAGHLATTGGIAKRASCVHSAGNRSSIVAAGASGRVLAGAVAGGRSKSAAAVLGDWGGESAAASGVGDGFEELVGARPGGWIGGLKDSQQQQQRGQEEQKEDLGQMQGERGKEHGGEKLLYVDFGWVGLGQDAAAVVLLKNLTSMPADIDAWVDPPAAGSLVRTGNSRTATGPAPAPVETAMGAAGCRDAVAGDTSQWKSPSITSISLGSATAVSCGSKVTGNGGGGDGGRMDGGFAMGAASGPFRAAQGNSMMMERRRQAAAQQALQGQGGSTQCSQKQQHRHQGVVVMVEQLGALLKPWRTMSIKLVAHNNMPGDYIRVLNVQVGL